MSFYLFGGVPIWIALLSLYPKLEQCFPISRLHHGAQLPASVSPEVLLKIQVPRLHFLEILIQAIICSF